MFQLNFRMITSFFFFSGGGVQQLDSVAFEEYQLQNLELFSELLIVNFISLNSYIEECQIVGSLLLLSSN